MSKYINSPADQPRIRNAFFFSKLTDAHLRSRPRRQQRRRTKEEKAVDGDVGAVDGERRRRRRRKREAQAAALVGKNREKKKNWEARRRGWWRRRRKRCLEVCWRRKGRNGPTKRTTLQRSVRKRETRGCRWQRLRRQRSGGGAGVRRGRRREEEEEREQGRWRYSGGLVATREDGGGWNVDKNEVSDDGGGVTVKEKEGRGGGFRWVEEENKVSALKQRVRARFLKNKFGSYLSSPASSNPPAWFGDDLAVVLRPGPSCSK